VKASWSEGLHANRLWRDDRNALEKNFAEAWRRNNSDGVDLLAWMLGDGTRQAPVSERDAIVAATVIQWLGSEVGQGFLSEAQSEPRLPRLRNSK
jgi:hypothetical protein